MPVDYEYAKIYRIFSKSAGLVYYGSTCQKVSVRVASHRRKFKRWKKTNGASGSYTSSFIVMEFDDWEYERVIKCPCSCIKELRAIEGKYIRENECVNRRIAGRTMKEWCEDNKEKINEYSKEYRENNKDKINKANKKYYENNKEYFKEYREDNKEINKEYKKKYYEDNKEKIKEVHKKYREDNKERISGKKKEWYEKNKERLKEKRKLKQPVNVALL